MAVVYGVKTRITEASAHLLAVVYLQQLCFNKEFQRPYLQQRCFNKEFERSSSVLSTDCGSCVCSTRVVG